MDARPKMTDEEILAELEREAVERASKNQAPEVKFVDPEPEKKPMGRLAPRDVKTRNIGIIE